MLENLAGKLIDVGKYEKILGKKRGILKKKIRNVRNLDGN